MQTAAKQPTNTIHMSNKTTQPDGKAAAANDTEKTAHSLALTGVPHAMASLRIPGDVVNRATADLADDERSAIRWLHSHAIEKGLSLEEIAAAISRDKNTLYQVFTGRHGASKTAICAEIAKYKKLVEAREGIEKLDFIETALTRKIFRLVDSARTYQRCVFVFSDSQVGKTTALKEYTRRNNHGATIYVSVPTGGALGDFMRGLARALRIPVFTSSRELRERIVSAFDARMVLIVDEVHQCFLRAGTKPQSHRHLLVMEFVREIFDSSGCGLVVCGTNTVKSEMEHGFAAGWLTQLSRRRLAALNIRPTPEAADLIAFAAAYGLPPPDEEAAQLQARVIGEEALGVWLTLLRMAAGIAAKKKEKMEWSHVLRAHDARRKLEA
jgi:DNA transposition AAA+ family ATPase